MISFENGYQEVPGFHDPACFGPESMKMNWAKGKEEMMVGYEEGPWVSRRGDIYYMTYPAGGVPEHMAYSTAPSIHGPWTYRGRIMDEAENAFTIHGGEVEYKGRNYMFYHNGALPNGGGFHRSSCVEEFTYNEDGSIPFIPFTRKGPAPVGSIDPYKRVEAETMAWSWGVKTDRLAGKDHYVTKIDNGDWIKVREVEFGSSGPKELCLEILNFQNPANVEFYADAMGGRPFATVEVKDNGTFRVPAAGNVSGRHDVYILFRGGDGQFFEMDWWQVK